MNPPLKNPKLSFDKLRWAVSEARHSDLPIRAVNPVIQRASTVVFDSVEEAFAMGPRTQAGLLHASSYGTVGTQTTFTLMDQVARLEGAGTFPVCLDALGAERDNHRVFSHA